MAVSTRDVLLIIRAHNQASHVLRSIGRDVGTMNAQMSANVQRLEQWSAAMTGAGLILTGLGVAASRFYVTSLREATEWGRGIAWASTQVDDARITFDLMTEAGKKAGREIPVAMKEIPRLMFDILSTLNPVQQADFPGLVEQFSKAAVAGQADLRSSSLATMNIINAWQMRNEDLSVGMDTLNGLLDMQFRTIQRGTGTYEELTGSLGRAIPPFSAFNQEVETMLGSWALLTRMGLSPSMAATSMARAMELIARPENVSRLEEQGAAIRGAGGDFLQLNEIIENLIDAYDLAGATGAHLADVISTMFGHGQGTIQARRFLLLAIQNHDVFNEWVRDIRNSEGDFTRAYNIMLEQPQMALQLLANRWQALRIEIGVHLFPMLEVLIGTVNRLMTVWGELGPEVQASIVRFGALTSAITLTVGIVMALMGLIGGVIAVFARLRGGITAGILYITRFTGTVGAVLSLLFILITRLDESGSGILNFAHGVSGAFDSIFSSFGGMVGLILLSTMMFSAQIRKALGFLSADWLKYQATQVGALLSSKRHMAEQSMIMNAHIAQMERRAVVSVNTAARTAAAEDQVIRAARQVQLTEEQGIRLKQRIEQQRTALNQQRRTIEDALAANFVKQVHVQGAALKRLQAEYAMLESRVMTYAQVQQQRQLFTRTELALDQQLAQAKYRLVLANLELDASYRRGFVAAQTAALNFDRVGLSIGRAAGAAMVSSPAFTALAAAKGIATGAAKALTAALTFLTSKFVIITAGLALLVHAFMKSGEAKREATQRTKEYADMLDEVMGKIDELDRKRVWQNIEDEAKEAMSTLGINSRLVTEAIVDQGSALTSLRDRLQETVSLGQQWLDIGPADRRRQEALTEEEQQLYKNAVAAQTLLDIIMREVGAIDAANKVWEDRIIAQHGNIRNTEEYINLIRAGTAPQEAFLHVLKRLTGGGEEFNDVQQELIELGLFTNEELQEMGFSGGVAADGLDEVKTAAEIAAEAIRNMTEMQKGVHKAFSDIAAPARAVDTWLDQIRQQAEALAETVDDASWEDFVDEVDRNLSDLNAILEDQISDVVNFMENIETATLRTSEGFMTAITEMGLLTPDVISAMVGASDEELARFEANVLAAGELSSEGFAINFANNLEALDAVVERLTEVMVRTIIDVLDDGQVDFRTSLHNLMTVQMQDEWTATEAVARFGAGVTVDAMATRLDEGRGRIRNVMDGWRAELVNGLNPVLISVGADTIEPGIRRHFSDSGLNTGGLIPGRGPDRDTIIAALTPGEFVLRRRAVDRLDPQSLHELNRTGDPIQAFFNEGGFTSIDDVPKVPSLSHVGMMGGLSQGGMNIVHHEVVEWLKKNLAPQLGAGIGWQAMWAAVQGKFPGANLHSAYRPGAITATGNPSYHGMGRAIDITPSMEMFNWIYDNYMAMTKELIFSPANQRQVRNGRHHMYSGITRAMHWDHIHWAMANGGLVTDPTMALIGEAGPEVVIPLDQLMDFIRDAIATPGGTGTVRDIMGALDAALRNEQAHADLEAAKQAVQRIRSELGTLASQRNMIMAQIANELSRPRMPTLQEEQAILQARERVLRLEQELAQMQRGPGAAEELAILQQEQRIRQMTEALEQMRNTTVDGGADMQEALANVAAAEFEVVRAAEVAAHIRAQGHETQALLLEFEAQKQLADATRELEDIQANHSIPTAEELKIAELELVLAEERLEELRQAGIHTTDELRLKEIELMLAKEALTEAEEAAEGPSQRLIELREQLAEIDGEYADKERELEEAVRGVTDAERNAIDANLRLIDAMTGLFALQPEALDFFTSIAQQAGLSAQQIQGIVQGVQAVQAANPQIAAARASGAQFFTDGSRYALKTSRGEWFLSTGPGQRRGLETLFGPATRVPSNHIGSIVGHVEDLFGGSGGIERVIAGQQALPRLARGAIALANRRGTPVLVGEGGHDEAIIPLPKGWRDGNLGGPSIKVEPGAVQVTIEGNADEDTIREAIDEAFDEFFERVFDEERGK